MAVSLGSLLFAYSRGPFIGFFLLIFFTAIVLGYYRLIIVGSISVLVLALFAFFFSGEDTRFLLIDTFNLADPSSAGHVIAWLEGLESMVTQPFGIGLATSGNASGVESDLQIGGENQFVIFGVQLGVPFLLVYILLLGTVINYSIKAYRVAKGTGYEVIPFVASTFKVAFLIPLFTANAEIYLYVAYISWWMAGQSVSIYESGESLGKPLKGAL